MKPAGGNGTAVTACRFHPGVRVGFCTARALWPPTGRPRATTASFLLLAVTLSLVIGTKSRAESQPAFDASRIKARTAIFGPEGKPFSMPTDAAVGKDGNLYVLDGVHHRVVIYDTAGRFLFEFGSRGSEAGQLLLPLGLTAAPDGKIYVADSGNHRFQIFTADGESLGAVPLPEAPSGSRPDPADVSIDAARSRLYITDNDNHKLQVYNLLTSSFEKPWGGPGQGRRQFRFPFLTDISSKGYVLVVEPINTRVQVLNPEGKFVGFIGAWGIKPGQLFRPKGVATFEDRVFVTDSYLGRVQVFDLQGSFFGVLSDSNGKPVEFSAPTGITVDAKRRRLYVVELSANCVCRMDLE